MPTAPPPDPGTDSPAALPAGPTPRRRFHGSRQRVARLAGATRARGAEEIERSLDRIFDEPFVVPNAAAAIRLLSSTESPPMGALGRYLEGQALVRIAARVTKLAARSRAAGAAARVAALPAAMSETGAATAAATAGGAAMSTATSMGSAALAAAAVAGATRATRTARRGLNDLRVLASYLASRARAEQIVLEKPLLRALTIAAYTDPRRRVDFRYAGSRGASAVLARWGRDVASSKRESRRRDEAEAWVQALDRLDLRTLRVEWDGRD